MEDLNRTRYDSATEHDDRETDSGRGGDASSVYSGRGELPRRWWTFSEYRKGRRPYPIQSKACILHTRIESTGRDWRKSGLIERSRQFLLFKGSWNAWSTVSVHKFFFPFFCFFVFGCSKYLRICTTSEAMFMFCLFAKLLLVSHLIKKIVNRDLVCFLSKASCISTYSSSSHASLFLSWYVECFMFLCFLFTDLQ